MKVFLLVLDFSIDGTHDSNVEVYATRKAAQKAMKEQFNATLPEYKESYAEEDIEFDEPFDNGAQISLRDNYSEKHDEWCIVEKEVIE